MITIPKQIFFLLLFVSRFIKKVEHSWKALVHDGVYDSHSPYLLVQLHIHIFLTAFFSFQDTVSVHRPSFYANRFLKFMGSTVFKKINRKSLY